MFVNEIGTFLMPFVNETHRPNFLSFECDEQMESLSSMSFPKLSTDNTWTRPYYLRTYGLYQITDRWTLDIWHGDYAPLCLLCLSLMRLSYSVFSCNI